MNKRFITFDFSKPQGKLKPINSINQGPLFSDGLEVDFTDEYKACAFSQVRVSDMGRPYGLNQYIDVHCIFPDFSLDERFPESYNFEPTDRYLKAVANTGAEIFLRLGESLDRFAFKPYTLAPRDVEKWARVVEHIIAHYNEGWGKGLKLKIKYVEIWQCVDREEGWSSDSEDYLEFYRLVANHLKERFPRLKIGAYSSGGFCALNHYDASEEQKAYITYLERFLAYISNKETYAPLDFLSWECYADEPEEISLHSNYARSYLAQSAHKKAQSIVTSFDVGCKGDKRVNRHYPSSLIASLIIAHKCQIDAMFYSSASQTGSTPTMFFSDTQGKKYTFGAYQAYKAFGELYKYPKLATSSEDYRREVYSLGTYSDTEGAIIVTSRDYQGIVELTLKQKSFTNYTVVGMVGGGEGGRGIVSASGILPLTSDKITLKVGSFEVYLITLK